MSNRIRIMRAATLDLTTWGIFKSTLRDYGLSWKSENITHFGLGNIEKKEKEVRRFFMSLLNEAYELGRSHGKGEIDA